MSPITTLQVMITPEYKQLLVLINLFQQMRSGVTLSRPSSTFLGLFAPSRSPKLLQHTPLAEQAAPGLQICATKTGHFLTRDKAKKKKKTCDELPYLRSRWTGLVREALHMVPILDPVPSTSRRTIAKDLFSKIAPNGKNKEGIFETLSVAETGDSFSSLCDIFVISNPSLFILAYALCSNPCMSSKQNVPKQASQPFSRNPHAHAPPDDKKKPSLVWSSLLATELAGLPT